MKMTITEALAEIKLITKKVASTQEYIMAYSTRPQNMIDPLQSEGGAKTVLKRKMQSAFDLFNRQVMLRTAINNSNAVTKITIGTQTKTVSEWLAWRREVATSEQSFLSTIVRGVDIARKQKQKPTGEDKPSDIEVHVPESEIRERAAQIEEVLSGLDGKLSLNNATTTIEV